MYEDSIPISDLREFSFCPRIPWFHSNSFGSPKSSIWMLQGEEYHIDREKLMRKRLLRRFQNQDHRIIYKFYVFSQKYGIHGIVDAVIELKDEIFPVEFKLQKGSFSKGIKNQILGYAICLEEMTDKKVPKGFVVSGKNAKVQEIQISEDEKKEISLTITNLKTIMRNSLIPESSATAAKCAQCEYLNFCNDREL